MLYNASIYEHHFSKYRNYNIDQSQSNQIEFYVMKLGKVKCKTRDVGFRPKVGQIGTFYWNLIWKGNGFVSFGDNLTLFGLKHDIPSYLRMMLGMKPGTTFKCNGVHLV